MKPIRITAHMLQPVAFHPAEGLSIDSPLLYALKLEERGEAFFEPRHNDRLAKETAEPDPRMPLLVHRAGGTWCYAASLAELHGHHGTELAHWNKRLDEAAALAAMERGAVELGKRRKIPTGSGEFKSYHMPLWLEVVDRLVWYAMGDRDEVLRLLTTHVRGLGRKRNSGHGAVAAWNVEEVDVPPDRWMWRAPVMPARHIPVAMLGEWSGETAWAGYRPPYWLAANQAWCAAVQWAPAAMAGTA
jgi:CRISPR type IV-associated protein Csf3